MSLRRALCLATMLAAGLLSSTLSAQSPADIDQTEVCLLCHDDVDGIAGAPVEHAPVAAGDCTACHNPHVAKHPGLLLERPALLCAGCHAEVAEEMKRPVVHSPVAEGRCGDCHESHGAQHSKLLNAPRGEICVTCHEEVEAWAKLPVQHSPVVRGKCWTCHEPHASDNPALATQPGGSSCSSCHPVSAAFKRRHSGYPVENTECQQCHDPHASSRSGLFREQLHPPFETGDCETCHLPAAGQDPFALRLGEAELCGDCHEEQVTESRHAPFPHVSAGGDNCTACHNPHSGVGSALLHGDLESTCLACHDPGGASSGQEGRFVSHGDLGCDSCHTPHGADRPLLLAGDPTQLCADCHSHQHGITHPLGEDSKDPRTGQPMTCITCHGIHDAPHDKYLHRAGSRELCIGCHRDRGAQR